MTRITSTHTLTVSHAVNMLVSLRTIVIEGLKRQRFGRLMWFFRSEKELGQLKLPKLSSAA